MQELLGHKDVSTTVNFAILTLHGSDPDASVLFETSIHQRFFNIILVDFLSRTDKKAPVKQSSYLGALRTISAHPRFDVDNSVAALRDATYAFVHWLEQEVSVDVWLPPIGTQTSMQISRLNFLKMCGDISKHNVLRSVGVAEELQQTLAASGVSVELEDVMLALGDFYERFHTDTSSTATAVRSQSFSTTFGGVFTSICNPSSNAAS